MRRFCVVSAVFALLTILSGRALQADDTEKTSEKAKTLPSKQSPESPLAPKGALKQFVVHPGLRVELVACEPQVVDPVAIAFDEDGRLWVVEMRDYPNGPKRPPGAPDGTPRPAGSPPAGMSRIRVLEDRNRDGFFETARTFADKLLFATGLQPWRGGVIVTLAGEVAYFKDTTGDGTADVRETWFTGFARKNPQLRANHPTFALDNRMYIANGLRGGDVIARKADWSDNAKPVSISGRDFRFDPLTGEYNAVSGAGQFGLTFDDFGNRFICSNRHPCRHIVLENRYLKRNPHLAVSSVLHDVSPPGDASRVFPISNAWTTSNLHAGQFTAASGVTLYRGHLLPEEFRGNSFVCEPTGNLVHRDVLKPKGATFTSRPGRQGVEFLATKDEWFRPVSLANGPDGALYVVDMYRAVIEHPQWVPEELKNRPDARFGDDRGRIYRIVPAGDREASAPRSGADAAPRAKTGRLTPTARLSKTSTADLVKLLQHPNAWHRMTAARLLYERQDKAAVKPLQAMLRDQQKSQRTRVHALWALRGLGTLQNADVKSVLQSAWKNDEFRLLEHALRLSEGTWTTAELGIFLTFPYDISDPRARLQAALSLGEVKHAQVRINGLAHLGVNAGDDLWIRRAILSSASGKEVQLLQRLIDLVLQSRRPASRGTSVDQRGTAAHRELFNELGELIGSRGRTSETTAALSGLNRLDADNGQRPSKSADRAPRDHAHRLRLAGMLGLARGLSRRGRELATFVAALPVEDRKPIQSLYADVVRTATSATVPRQRRLTAISFLKYVGETLAVPALKQLTLHESNQAVRLAAIPALAAFSPGKIDRQLLVGFDSQTPEIKRAILTLALSGKTRTTMLLDEIAADRISINELDPTQVRRLTRHREKDIRNRAKELLAAAVPADRKQVLAEFQRALSLNGDAQRGRKVFQKNCAACHRIGKLGVNVAPDISDSRTKTPAQLLVSILDPNRAIDSNYISYTTVTVDGKVHTGIIATETASSITLRQPDNKTVSLLRRDIERLKSNGVSLMPVGLEKNISVQQMADVIAFIKHWRYLDGRVPVSP